MADKKYCKYQESTLHNPFQKLIFDLKEIESNADKSEELAKKLVGSTLNILKEFDELFIKYSEGKAPFTPGSLASAAFRIRKAVQDFQEICFNVDSNQYNLDHLSPSSLLMYEKISLFFSDLKDINQVLGSFLDPKKIRLFGQIQYLGDERNEFKFKVQEEIINLADLKTSFNVMYDEIKSANKGKLLTIIQDIKNKINSLKVQTDTLYGERVDNDLVDKLQRYKVSKDTRIDSIKIKLNKQIDALSILIEDVNLSCYYAEILTIYNQVKTEASELENKLNQQEQLLIEIKELLNHSIETLQDKITSSQSTDEELAWFSAAEVLLNELDDPEIKTLIQRYSSLTQLSESENLYTKILDDLERAKTHLQCLSLGTISDSSDLIIGSKDSEPVTFSDILPRKSSSFAGIVKSIGNFAIKSTKRQSASSLESVSESSASENSNLTTLEIDAKYAIEDIVNLLKIKVSQVKNIDEHELNTLFETFKRYSDTDFILPIIEKINTGELTNYFESTDSNGETPSERLNKLPETYIEHITSIYISKLKKRYEVLGNFNLDNHEQNNLRFNLANELLDISNVKDYPFVKDFRESLSRDMQLIVKHYTDLKKKAEETVAELNSLVQDLVINNGSISKESVTNIQNTHAESKDHLSNLDAASVEIITHSINTTSVDMIDDKYIAKLHLNVELSEIYLEAIKQGFSLDKYVQISVDQNEAFKISYEFTDKWCPNLKCWSLVNRLKSKLIDRVCAITAIDRNAVDHAVTFDSIKATDGLNPDITQEINKIEKEFKNIATHMPDIDFQKKLLEYLHGYLVEKNVDFNNFKEKFIAELHSFDDKVAQQDKEFFERSVLTIIAAISIIGLLPIALSYATTYVTTGKAYLFWESTHKQDAQKVIEDSISSLDITISA